MLQALRRESPAQNSNTRQAKLKNETRPYHYAFNTGNHQFTSSCRYENVKKPKETTHYKKFLRRRAAEIHQDELHLIC